VDEYSIGWTAVKNRVPFITTLSAAEAIVRGLKALDKNPLNYTCLQDYYRVSPGITQNIGLKI
jgi:hypothetical protein